MSVAVLDGDLDAVEDVEQEEKVVRFSGYIIIVGININSAHVRYVDWMG